MSMSIHVTFFFFTVSGILHSPSFPHNETLITSQRSLSKSLNQRILTLTWRRQFKNCDSVSAESQTVGVAITVRQNRKLWCSALNENPSK